MPDPPTKPRRRWLRFSLRSLLLLIAVIAIPLGWYVSRVRNQKLVVAEVLRLKGGIRYAYEVPFHMPDREPLAPKWLRDFLGEDFFADVAGVEVHDGRTPGDQVTDQTLSRIAALPHLTHLILYSNHVTDAGLKCLAGHRKLEFLNLWPTTGMPITDEGLTYIATLENLRHLNLGHGVPITDAGLPYLYGMRNLESLGLPEPHVSDGGLAKIRKALPNCTINRADPDTLTGKVIEIVDGDTIKVVVGINHVTVLLRGTDAPELGQEYSYKSKQALAELVFEKEVRINVFCKDHRDRTVGDLYIGNTLVNEKLIEDGWAWDYSDIPKSKRYAKLEREARAAKRGLWAGEAPIPPWNVRTKQGTVQRYRGE